MKRCVYVFLALIFCQHAHSDADCNYDGNQSEMNACAAANLKIVDDKLNELYQQKMASSGSKKRLQESQRAWLNFRDKACLYEAGPREESGSIWPLEQDLCLAKHTKRRIEDLNQYIECTDNGCP